jgi:hypothetical protein
MKRISGKPFGPVCYGEKFVSLLWRLANSIKFEGRERLIRASNLLVRFDENADERA